MKRAISTLASAIICFSLSVPHSALARDVVLSWDPVTTLQNGNPVPGTVQYKVHMGTATRNYSQVEVATLVQLINGSVVHSRVLNFPDDVDVYMAVSAYYIDAQGNPSRDSGVSNEVVQQGKVRLQPPAPPELIGQIPGQQPIQLASFEYEIFQGKDQPIKIDDDGNAVIPDTFIQFLIQKHPELLTGELELSVEVDGVVYDAA